MSDDMHAVPQRDDRRVAELLRRGGDLGAPPPARIWEAIAAEVDRERVATAAPRPVTADPEHAAGTRRAGSRRSRTSWGLLAAAAAGALVTWLGLGLVDRTPDGDLVASGQLSALAEGAPSGSAEVIEVDGRQRLHVELSGDADPGDGYIEVWLLRPDVSGMITVGVLDGQSGDFVLPEGVDLGTFPVVDLSREHLDGDPAHGGDSIVRGEIVRGELG